MKLKIKKYLTNKKLISIILFAFILRITLFIIAQPWTLEVEQNRIVRSDAIGYNELAKSIINDFSFEFKGQKNSFRTPGYPVFLAIIYSIFGVKPYIVLIFQIIINIFSILILYEIAKKIFNRKIALISSFLFSIDPHTILYTCELFTETFFTFIILLAFMYFVKAIDTKKVKCFILAALFFGLSTLIRPISQFIPIILIGLILIYPKFNFRLKFKSSFIIVMIFLMTISPWMYRNYKSFSTINLSSLPAWDLIFYNVAYTEYVKTNNKIEQIRRVLSKQVKLEGANFSHYMNESAKTFENGVFYKKVSFNYIGDNVFLFFYVNLRNSTMVFLNVGTKGILSMFGIKEIELPNMAANSLTKNIINIFKYKPKSEILLILFMSIFFLIVYTFSIIGIFNLYKKKQYYKILLFLVIILYYTLLLSAMGNAARFKVPVVPFYSILSAVGLNYLIYKRKKLS